MQYYLINHWLLIINDPYPNHIRGHIPSVVDTASLNWPKNQISCESG
jgi:hypothetical protein